MKIVIDIPKTMIQELKDGCFGVKHNVYELAGCIMNGTVLPEHGRLIDADAIKKKYPLMYNDFGMEFNNGIHEALDEAPTILEATRGGDNKMIKYYNDGHGDKIVISADREYSYIGSEEMIPKRKIENAIAEMIEEKDFAYADFEQYKVDILGVDSQYVEDELPYDDFRYGMERCIEIIRKYMGGE